MIEIPQSFVVSTECQKAAEQNGFRRSLGEVGGSAAFGSTTAKGLIYLAATGPMGPWYFAVDHLGILQELQLPSVDFPGPGHARFAFDTLSELYLSMHRVYELGVCLPDAPLKEFEHQVASLLRNTEAEQLIIRRIGQDIFRARLLKYWQGRCPLTGISDPGLLRASHITPWSECENDGERLNVYNGLLLSALCDAAFDQGLVTFDDEGKPEFSSAITVAARDELRWQTPILLSDEHRRRLVNHRKRTRLASSFDNLL